MQGCTLPEIGANARAAHALCDALIDGAAAPQSICLLIDGACVAQRQFGRLRSLPKLLCGTVGTHMRPYVIAADCTLVGPTEHTHTFCARTAGHPLLRSERIETARATMSQGTNLSAVPQ